MNSDRGLSIFRPARAQGCKDTRRLRKVQGGEPDEDQAYAESGGILSERKAIDGRMHWFGFSTRLYCRLAHSGPVALELLAGMHDVSKRTRLLMKVKDNH